MAFSVHADFISKMKTMIGVIPAMVAAGFVIVFLIVHVLAKPRDITSKLDPEAGHRRLVVLAHGMSGRAPFESAVELAREALPDSDFLVFDYDVRAISNANPYAIANSIERQIHEVDVARGYDEIVLVGHSLGGMLLRKVIVWGNGLEEDRDDFGRRGERAWVKKISRFVSLASINRGWSITPKPDNMTLTKYLTISIGERLGRLSQSGQLVLALQRGSPFVADARVQWISLCRGEFSDQRHVPQTIHLLGDRDDIVSKEDGMDLIAAKNTIFVTLQDTGHREIGTALRGGAGTADQNRRNKVRWAMQGQLDRLDPDKTVAFKEELSVERIAYIMHGIRDYGEWTDLLRNSIQKEAAGKGIKLAVINQKYGHFPMLPFLLYWDRQKNVRVFMDEYTENLARFPHARKFDYVGHSNGSYILASALQTYKTLSVDKVYFAGSVVPKHYRWRELADQGRVRHVANVVATGDWVVALFPRFFEQIADWRGIQPMRGLLDIGSAGFRGFQDAKDAENRIENIQFAEGGHGVGVDATSEKKVRAIARYIVSDDRSGFEVFRDRNVPNAVLAFFSNICWVVWLGLAIILFGLGFAAFTLNPWAGLAYLLFVLGLLNSV